MERKALAQVLEEHRNELRAIPGVVGVALGVGALGPCIRVYLSHAAEGRETHLPATIEGYPVEPQITGEFRALDEPE